MINRVCWCLIKKIQIIIYPNFNHFFIIDFIFVFFWCRLRVERRTVKKWIHRLDYHALHSHASRSLNPLGVYSRVGYSIVSSKVQYFPIISCHITRQMLSCMWKPEYTWITKEDLFKGQISNTWAMERI